MAEKKDSGDDRIWLYAAGAVTALLVLVPALLAVAVWMAAARYLGKREYWALIGVGLLGWVLYAKAFATDYAHALSGLVRGGFGFDDIPWLMLTASVAFLVGVYGLLSGTSVARDKMPSSLLARLETAPPKMDVIVPTAEAKARLKPAKPTGGSLTIDSGVHSITGGGVQGDRKIPLGIGINGQPVYLSEKEAGTHGVILGATGSGKSKTIEQLAGGLLDLGWSGMLLDLKEDTAPGGLRDFCATYGAAHSIPFQELRLSDHQSKSWFNALSGMGPDEIRDTILTLSDFDDAYWQSINKEMLGQTVNLVVWAHQVDPVNFPEPTMYDIGKLLSTGNLKNATRKHRAVVLDAMKHLSNEDFRALAEPSQDQAKSAIGFGAKLTLIYDTQAGRTVLRQDATGSKHQVDVTNPGLTYVGLDSLGKADLTKVISSSMLQRMSVYASDRISGGVNGADARLKRFLIVDEANWVDRTIVQGLLSRARSAGIAVFLCTQGPKDWIDEKGDDWGKLTQNTNVAIIMRQGEPASAELCADYIGTRKQTDSSTSARVVEGAFGQKSTVVTGQSSREVDAYLVEPETLRTIGVGEAVIKIGVPARVEWARISMRDPSAGPSLR